MIRKLVAVANRLFGSPDYTPTATILDSYITLPPSFHEPFKLFQGEWASEIPGYGGGRNLLFDDGRIKWFGEQCGDFAGKRILELGPLEGAHTYMMAKAGASSITSIEANARAFLKCLIVKNAFNFNADFRLGDFGQYLTNCSDRYDLVVASGVLYHMEDPLTLLKDAARVSNMIALWTHFYDAEVIRSRTELRGKFSDEPRVETLGGRRILSYRQSYREVLHQKEFCGGMAPISYWLSRESLLGALDELGFSVTIKDEEKGHPNGPCMALFARKRPLSA